MHRGRQMKRFVKQLAFKDCNFRRPIMQEIIVENWDLDIAQSIVSKYEKKWQATLKYENTLYIRQPGEISENMVKERIFKDISWQIYGETQRLIDYLRQKIMDGSSKEHLLEITNEIDREIKGEFI